MKNKIRYAFPALVLCMSALFMPVSAYAQSAPDTTPPTISAKLSGDTLHIEAADDASGVDAVYIGEKRVNYRVDNAVDVAFSDYAGTGGQTVGVYAVDFAGNKSDVVSVKNPYYKAPTATPPAQTSKPTTTKPPASASADPEQESEAKPFTPDGQATVTDNATDEDGKEFYTFTTPNDNVFYLVIDKQRDSDNVYFLNAVTEDDLAALAVKDEDKKDTESAIPEVAVCNCTEKCAPGEVNTNCPICKNDLKTCVGKAAPEPDTEAEAPKKENSAGSMIFIVLAIAAAGGAGYYFKVLKPKRDLDDAEDLDDLLDDGEEPMVNEDAEDTPELSESTYGTATEPIASYDDYPEDDYPDDEPEEEPERRE